MPTDKALPYWLADPSRANIVPLMLPEGKLNPFALACALVEACNKGAIAPSVGEFQALMETDDELVTILNSYYPDPNDGKGHYLGLDTAERDMVAYVLAQRFAKRDWPTFGDGGAAANEFLVAYCTGLTEAGWRSNFTLTSDVQAAVARAERDRKEGT